MTDSKHTSGSFTGRVLARRAICDEHFALTIAIEGFPHAQPGQFVQLLCRAPDANDVPHDDVRTITDAHTAWTSIETPQPLLRRPFSIAGIRQHGTTSEVDVLARLIGPGTAWLSERKEGDPIGVLGPLGHGFTIPKPETFTRLLLVAGGVGLPPIRWMGEVLTRAGHCCTAFIGSRTRSLLPLTTIEEPAAAANPSLCVREFAECDIETCLTTDDGSCGFHGRVTDALRGWAAALPEDDRVMVYACGPEPMLKATAALCAELGYRCEVAMERMMGCGMATCQSCVVPIADKDDAQGWRYALCCTDGPVFDAALVQWEQPH